MEDAEDPDRFARLGSYHKCSKRYADGCSGGCLGGCPEYVIVGLSGELDVEKVAALRAALIGALDSADLVFADLSGVSFMDSVCLTELIVHHQLHTGRLFLYRPSAQAELSVVATGLEDWITFHPDENSALRSIPQT